MRSLGIMMGLADLIVLAAMWFALRALHLPGDLRDAGLVGAGFGVFFENVKTDAAFRLQGRRLDKAMREHEAAHAVGFTAVGSNSAGLVTAFGSGSYSGARAARDLHALRTGRVGTRLANKWIGRNVVSKLWVR